MRTTQGISVVKISEELILNAFSPNAKAMGIRRKTDRRVVTSEQEMFSSGMGGSDLEIA